MRLSAARRAGRIVTDNLEGAEFESGDLVGAIRANVIQWGQVSEIGLIAAGVDARARV